MSVLEKMRNSFHATVDIHSSADHMPRRCSRPLAFSTMPAWISGPDTSVRRPTKEEASGQPRLKPGVAGEHPARHHRGRAC
jgi:hypothetical protein